MHCRKNATVAFSMLVRCWVVRPPVRLTGPREYRKPGVCTGEERGGTEDPAEEEEGDDSDDGPAADAPADDADDDAPAPACPLLLLLLGPLLWLMLMLPALALEWQSRKSSAVHSGLTSGPPSQSFMAWLLPTSVRKRSTGAASSGESVARLTGGGEEDEEDDDEEEDVEGKLW